MKIYIKDFKKTKNTTILSLLCDFLKINNNFESLSIDWRNIIKTSATYKDKECIKIQCSSEKRRSFEDIIDICKTYFPNVTDKKVAQTLDFIFKQCEQKHKQKYGFLYCGDVQKWVLVGKNKNCKILYCYNYANCQEKINKKVFKYSLLDILTLMGYTKEQYTIEVNN